MGGRLTDDQLQELYTWVDEIPLSRPKRNITRDFSDGVLFAEVIGHYYPQLVELHNYSAANSLKQKVYNWETLQKKVLRKLRCPLSSEEIQAVCACRPNQIEKLLIRLKGKIAAYTAPVERPSGNLAAASRLTPVSSSGRPKGNNFFASSSGGAAGDDRDEDFRKNPQDEDKDRVIIELRDTISILELKISKLEQLLQLKDNKIAALQQQL